MIQIAVITPVPDVIDTLIQNSMLRKAVEKRAVELHTVNLRELESAITGRSMILLLAVEVGW